jgi:ribosomal protein L12E/L44/L45/RPP1/RPP2
MSLEYTCAYLVSVLAGHEHPTEEMILKIVKSTGAEAHKEQAHTVVKALEGKNVHDLIKAGLGKLAAAAPASASAPISTGKSPKKSPKKASPKKAAKEEEEDADMGFSLFD